MNALELVRDWQDGRDGWDDNTMLILLCEFINEHNLTAKLQETLEDKILYDEGEVCGAEE